MAEGDLYARYVLNVYVPRGAEVEIEDEDNIWDAVNGAAEFMRATLPPDYEVEIED